MNIFFYDECFDFKIMFDDFALNFSWSLLKKRKLNLIEKNIKVKKYMM